MALTVRNIAMRPAAVATLLVLLLSLQGCGDNGCYENRSSIPQAAFYSFTAPSQGIAIDSIIVYGIGHAADSLLIDGTSRISTLSLPFRTDSDTTSYVLQYAPDSVNIVAANDTLTFVYTRYPYFVSAACGVVFNYTITHFAYTHNMLDSAALVAPEVTNVLAENVKLFYYVATPSE